MEFFKTRFCYDDEVSIFQRFSVVLALSFTLFGCGAEADKNSIQDGQELPLIAEQPLVREPSSVPQICSALDFDDVSWPSDYVAADEMAFALGMNITGSFEGHAGWTNLSNNFDGQGVSMGILNQNLGQGTLQPLLINLRDNNKSVLENAMTPSMLDSLLGMLEKWERSSDSVTAVSALGEATTQSRRLVLNQDPNIDKKYAYAGIQTRSNSASVRWAKKTLYTDSAGRNFKSAWKTALKEIAGHPDYVSQQIEAAQYIHDRALDYKGRLGWKQLRAYLFLFDIVVQNGSLKDKHFEEYEDWLAEQTSRVTEEEQMLEMLEIRIKDVIPKWAKDVRSRKQTVILGSGFVHGEDRNLPVEYCYDPIFKY